MSYLIKDVIIFDGEKVLDKSSVVVVEDEKITYVGSEPPKSKEYKIISRPGHTLLPGLIDAHVHAIGGDTTTLSQALQFGVTTVLEMGNSYKFIAGLRQAARSSDMADYRTATAPISCDGGYPEPMLKRADASEEMAKDLATWPKIRSSEDAPALVQKSIDAGADYIKILQESGRSMGAEFPTATQEMQTAVVKAAHAKGLNVIGHALSLEDTLVILRSGSDGTAHTFMDQPPTDEIIQAYLQNNAWCCPTLVLAASMTGDVAKTTKEFAESLQVKKRLPQPSKDALCTCLNQKGSDCTFDYAVQSVKALKKAGIDILAGTDAAMVTLGTAHGASLHEELHFFVNKCDFTPIEALRSATSVTARCFGLTDRGRIQIGKRADLLLIEGNITEDINKSTHCKLVWKAGVFKDIS